MSSIIKAMQAAEKAYALPQINQNYTSSIITDKDKKGNPAINIKKSIDHAWGRDQSNPNIESQENAINSLLKTTLTQINELPKDPKGKLFPGAKPLLNLAKETIHFAKDNNAYLANKQIATFQSIEDTQDSKKTSVDKKKDSKGDKKARKEDKKYPFREFGKLLDKKVQPFFEKTKTETDVIQNAWKHDINNTKIEKKHKNEATNAISNLFSSAVEYLNQNADYSSNTTLKLVTLANATFDFAKKHKITLDTNAVQISQKSGEKKDTKSSSNHVQNVQNQHYSPFVEKKRKKIPVKDSSDSSSDELHFYKKQKKQGSDIELEKTPSDKKSTIQKLLQKSIDQLPESTLLLIAEQQHLTKEKYQQVRDALKEFVAKISPGDALILQDLSLKIIKNPKEADQKKIRDVFNAMLEKYNK